MDYTPGQEKSIDDLREQAHIARKQQLAKLMEKRAREDAAEAAMEATNAEIEEAMQPRPKKRRTHDVPLALALQPQLPIAMQPQLSIAMQTQLPIIN